MEYRIASAETEEDKAKERAFTGLGLTSRKNLCLHPEVCSTSTQFVNDSVQCRSVGVQGKERNCGGRAMP